MELISVEQKQELMLWVSLPNPCSDTHGFRCSFLLLNNPLVSQPCALCVCVCLPDTSPRTRLCIYRKKAEGEREEERSPQRALHYLPATNQVLCSLLFFCQRVPSCSLTKLLPGISGPEGPLLTTNFFPTGTLDLCDSGEIFSIFFRDNSQFGPSSWLRMGTASTTINANSITFSACLEMQV